MPYVGYSGQELEDLELDEMRREGRSMSGGTPTGYVSSEWVASVNQSLAMLMQEVESLRGTCADLRAVLDDADLRQLKLASRCESDYQRLEGAIQRIERVVDDHKEREHR